MPVNILSVPAVANFFDVLAMASLIPSTTFPLLKCVEAVVEAPPAAAPVATPPLPPALDAAAAAAEACTNDQRIITEKTLD